MYSTKQLIKELLTFMQEKKRKKIVVNEYIQQTERRIYWSKARKVALYKAIHETRTLSLEYRQFGKERRLYTCVTRCERLGKPKEIAQPHKNIG